MKAAVMRAQNAPLEIEDLDIDDPGPGELVVKTVASGICHSDLHVLEGSIPVPPPCVLGHEPAGIVEKVGPGVTSVAEGDRVIACLSRYCGTCQFCTGGRPYLCTAGFTGRPGGNLKPALTDAKGEPVLQFTSLSSFAEKMLTTEMSVVKIRDDMPLDRACLIGCGITTGLGAALHTVDIRAGDSVVVIGCGGVGLSAIQGARITGAGQIIAVDAQPWKFELARNSGATDCVDATDGNAVQAVMDLTGGGASYVFECIGLKPTIEQAVQMTGRGGTTVLVGVLPIGQTVEIAAADLTLQEKKVTGSLMGSNRFQFDMPRYVDFYLDGRLRLDEMISARIALDEVNDAFEALRKGEAARQVIMFD
ncbi:MAG: Zn-dependent alcohol dehydrogenase [Proteobacteria bacterium]|nr:Zn-dependent alcohol dehydrogenase [Pseudomonadota bacterium]